MVKILFAMLLVFTVYFAVVFFKDYAKASKEGRLEKTSFLTLGSIGFITNFFDTLGICTWNVT